MRRRARRPPVVASGPAFAPFLAVLALAGAALFALRASERDAGPAVVLLGALAGACELRAASRARVERLRLRHGGFVALACAPTALALTLAAWVLAQLGAALVALGLPPEERAFAAPLERALPLAAALAGAALTLALGRLAAWRAGDRPPPRAWLLACATPALALAAGTALWPCAALLGVAAAATVASLALSALLARRHGTDVFPRER